MTIFNENGKQMIFCLRPCKEKKEVKNLILMHGGKCIPSKFMVTNEQRESLVMLSARENNEANETFYHVNYIYDCHEQNRLLPLYDYKIHFRVTAEHKESRNAYNSAEDEFILKMVRNDEGNSSLAGNIFWKKMAENEFCKKYGRTWQSLKDRYKRLSKMKCNSSGDSDLFNSPEKMNNKEEAEMNISDGHEEEMNEVTNNVSKSSVEEKEMNDEICIESKVSEHAPTDDNDEMDDKDLVLNFINNVTQCMLPAVKVDVAFKYLFKFNGNVSAAEYFFLNKEIKPGYFLTTDEEDKFIIKCLCEDSEDNLKYLKEKYSEEFILQRCACLNDMEESDVDVMEKVTL